MTRSANYDGLDPAKLPETMTPVFVVDDDVDTAALLTDVLLRRGFAAVETHSAEECARLLHADRSAVVVTDVQMAGMSGLMLAALLRDGFPHVRTVIVTGVASDATAAEAADLGVFAFLRKPVKVPELVTAVTRALTA